LEKFGAVTPEKTIAFLSNTVTSPFNKHFQDLAVQHCDLGNLVQVLQTKVSADYLVVLLDYSYFFENVIQETALEKAALLEQLFVQFRKENSAKILLSNVVFSFPDICGTWNLDMHRELLRLNTEIDRLSETISDLVILNLFNIGSRLGTQRFYSFQNKFLFQTPFTKVATAAIANEIREKIELLESPRKKVLALDADNTLWGGVVGEDGVDNLQIDENYPGIIYKYFQNYVRTLKESGILLVLVSKNNLADVEEVFRKRKMPLKWDDFVLKRVNWQPKSQNLVEAAQELNIGIDSFVFVDDNPFEVSEVQNALSMVECYQLDAKTPLNNLGVLESIVMLKTPRVVAEDTVKTELYAEEQQRKTVSSTIRSVDEFIQTLNIQVNYTLNNKDHLARITQLINKTNQFNLTTRRYTEIEVQKMMEDHLVLGFQATDKFGDMGIVGVAIIIERCIDTFLLSCRVLGRRIEEKMLFLIQQEVEAGPIRSEYLKSPKNSQVEDFYDQMGFELTHGDDSKKEYVLNRQLDDIAFIKAQRN
jgi:FkbH-like protein